MTIQTSSSKRDGFFSCFRDVLYRNKGIGIFYFCLSFIFLPMQFMMTIARNSNKEVKLLSDMFYGNSMAYTPSSLFIFYVLTVGMAFAAPIIMLSYMQNKRAVDVFHSLPYRRDELLGANILAGLIYIMVPLAIDFAIIALLSMGFPDARPLATLSEIFFWLAPVMGVAAITTLACVMVGTTFDSFLFACGLHITPLVIYLIFFGLSSAFLVGFEDQDFLINDVSSLSPALIRMPNIGYTGLSDNILPDEMMRHDIIVTIIWIVISILLFSLSFAVYKRRKSEKAETATEKGPLSMLLRAVGTMAGGLCLAVLFSATMLSGDYNSKGFLGFVFLGSVIVYLVGDIIISKHIRGIKKALIPGIVFSLAVVLATSAFFFDVLHFSTAMPKREDIESVEVLRSSRWDYTGRFNNQPHYQETSTVYTSPEVIDAVLSFHKAQTDFIESEGIFKTRLRNSFPEDYTDTLSSPFYFGIIRYNLNNGKTVTRRYTYPVNAYAEAVYELESCDEFIKNNHIIFSLEGHMVHSVSAINLFGYSEKELQLSQNETDTLILSLREDMLSPSGKDILNEKPLGKISFLAKDIDLRKAYNWEDKKLSHYDTNSLSEITVMVTEGFHTTLDLLDKLGLSDAFENDISRLSGVHLEAPFGDNDGAVSEINFHRADSYSHDKSLGFNMTSEDLEEIEGELRGAALYDVPYVKILFFSDKVTSDIGQKEYTTIVDDNIQTNTVTFPEAATIENDDDYLHPTGMAYIPYEKLPERLKKTYIDQIDLRTDSWFINHCGMTVDFYNEEMQKFS